MDILHLGRFVSNSCNFQSNIIMIYYSVQMLGLDNL